MDGGIDGVIHSQAGIELLEECKILNGCNIGEAKITKSYNMKNCKNIIHTVAPQWYDNTIINKEELLKNCYINSLKLADINNAKSIAFPNLGMGVYAVPIDIGTKISIDTVNTYLIAENTKIEKVLLVCFEDSIYKSYLEYFTNTISKNKKCQQLVIACPKIDLEILKEIEKTRKEIKEKNQVGFFPCPKEFYIWLHKFYELELDDYNYIENHKLIANKKMEELTIDEILTKLTLYIRQDRFHTGLLAGVIEDGTLEKLVTLLRERTK